MPNDTEGRPPAPPSRPSAAEEVGLSAQQADDGLDRLVRLLAGIAQVPMAAFWVVDGDRSFLAAAHGLAARELPRRGPLLEQALKQDELFTVEDAARDARLAGDALLASTHKPRFFACVPIRGRDRQRLGLLCLMDVRARALDPAARAALAEVKPILEERLRLRADLAHDPQTGVLTRRQFDDTSDREWRRSMRGLAPISVIVAELDRLREFAAQEGPAALDRGLRATGLAMQYSLHRPGDYVGRYDASRFAALLPGTDETGAVETAERLRSAVELLAIPFPGVPTGLLTLSVGIETVHSESLSRRDLDHAVQAATVALREAQRTGGNRWLLAGSATGKELLGTDR